MLRKILNISLIGLALFTFSCITSNNRYKGRRTVSKRQAPEERKTSDQYETEQVDRLLEKQQKNKNKKDQYEDKRRAEEVKRIEKEAKKDKKKDKKVNDGEFRFY